MRSLDPIEVRTHYLWKTRCLESPQTERASDVTEESAVFQPSCLELTANEARSGSSLAPTRTSCRGLTQLCAPLCGWPCQLCTVLYIACRRRLHERFCQACAQRHVLTFRTSRAVRLWSTAWAPVQSDLSPEAVRHVMVAVSYKVGAQTKVESNEEHKISRSHHMLGASNHGFMQPLKAQTLQIAEI